MTYKSLAKWLIISFSGLLLIYIGVLTIAFMIPDSLLMEKWTESVNLIASEEKRWVVMTGLEATKLDTFTDNLMFQRLLNREGINPLSAAMWVDGYTRYWLGILAVLRPLLLFVSYEGIRYFNIFFILGLLCFVFSAVKKHLGKTFSTAFLFSMGMIHVWIFPLSLQYTTAYAVMMIATLFLFYLYEKKLLDGKRDIIFFFIVGSVTNFFDLLTVPLITFGIPYTLYFCLKNKDKIQSFKENILYTIRSGISWLAGYALTWSAKWIIGSIILQENIIKSALNQILFRSGAEEEVPIVMSDVYRSLIDLMFPSYMVKVLLIVGVVWIIYFLIHHKSWKNILNLSPVLLIGILPYVWFFALSNHNLHHDYFTYRNQAITTLVFLSFMLLSVNKTNAPRWIMKIKKKYMK
ncbi:hypothetical protein ACQKKE_11260 [Desemzia incerta]|uniref:hypothetical protein n=1 Tax=Desemzia incerta TaxID=82801 RepID=UPI003D03447E